RSEELRNAPREGRDRDGGSRVRGALADRGSERLVGDARRRPPRGSRVDDRDRSSARAAEAGGAARRTLSGKGRYEGTRRAARTARQGTRTARSARSA